MKIKIMFTYILSIFLLVSCSNNNKQASGTSSDKPSNTENNYLTMKINGVEWTADNNIFGAYHPKGYNKVIMISGSKGKKDKNEIPFNINIYNTKGPGEFTFSQGNKDLSVAQIANWSAEEFICGSMMGFDMKVNVTKASSNPDIIEASFSGVITCNTDRTMNITDGKFYYHE